MATKHWAILGKPCFGIIFSLHPPFAFPIRLSRIPYLYQEKFLLFWGGGFPTFHQTTYLTLPNLIQFTQIQSFPKLARITISGFFEYLVDWFLALPSTLFFPSFPFPAPSHFSQTGKKRTFFFLRSTYLFFFLP